MIRNVFAAAGIALFALSPAVMAQQSDSDNRPAAGGAMGADNSQVVSHAVLAGVTSAALIGAAFAVADNDSDDVVLGNGGSTGTTGTTPGNGGGTGTTGTTGTN
ncbi:hypothetical protein [Salinisphaera sp. T31B1]|uniref:hypothetical protein n=1 Tax=Salinisphaera sp. T31B1 TaxID=727963 RepID=UPI00333E27F6